jgi:hypothetical protein
VTNGRELKRRVRERMEQTGENYTRALREIRKEEQERTEESGGAEAQTTFIGPTT